MSSLIEYSKGLDMASCIDIINKNLSEFNLTINNMELNNYLCNVMWDVFNNKTEKIGTIKLWFRLLKRTIIKHLQISFMSINNKFIELCYNDYEDLINCIKKITKFIQNNNLILIEQNTNLTKINKEELFSKQVIIDEKQKLKKSELEKEEDEEESEEESEDEESEVEDEKSEVEEEDEDEDETKKENNIKQDSKETTEEEKTEEIIQNRKWVDIVKKNNNLYDNYNNNSDSEITEKNKRYEIRNKRLSKEDFIEILKKCTKDACEFLVSYINDNSKDIEEGNIITNIFTLLIKEEKNDEFIFLDAITKFDKNPLFDQMNKYIKDNNFEIELTWVHHKRIIIHPKGMKNVN